MKKLCLLLTLVSILLLPLYSVANDRPEPDYVVYEASLAHIDQPSKLLGGTAKVKIDIDHTFLIFNLTTSNISSPVLNVSIIGPSTLTVQANDLVNHKITITEDQANDIAHGLYEIIVVTKNNPQGELRGTILPSNEYNVEPKQKWGDLNKEGILNGKDFKSFAHDISQYMRFLSTKFKKNNETDMKMKKEKSTIHRFPETIQQQLRKNKPAILGKYFFYKQIPDYSTIAYHPQQFNKNFTFMDNGKNKIITDAGNFTDWDFLNTPNDQVAQMIQTSQWISLELNRPAVLGVIWRGGDSIPQWLQSWTLSRSVSIDNIRYPVFIKQFKTKKVILGSAKDLDSSGKKENYLLIFAEENEHPSTAFITPSDLEKPQANSICPEWVHDQYVTQGPDGKWYATWHPQIDPVYWCYFGHEHGADPAEFDKNIKLPFGYAGEAMGMHEKHMGFKVYVWDDKYGYRILALQHQGTSSNQAVCGRYHELDFMIKKINSEEILAKRYFVGDYGVSRSLVTGKPFINPDCPDQKSIPSSGARFLPIADERKSTESWVVSSEGVIGFDFADFVVSTLDSVRLCKDYACDDLEITSNTGSLREISYVRGLGPTAGLGYSGTFYTDPTGTKLLFAHEPHSVEQYTKPGVSISSDLPQSIHYYNSTHCYDIEGFGSKYTCGINISAAPVMREASLHVPN